MTPPHDLVIIEPRLIGASGHYAELVRAIVAGASPGSRFTLKVPDAGLRICRELISEPGSTEIVDPVRFDSGSILAEAAAAVADACDNREVLLLTAKGGHAAGLSLRRVAGDTLARVSLLFHWPARTIGDRMMHRLGREARRHCLALATTAAVAESLRSLGWHRVLEIHYPTLAPPTAPLPDQPFRHALVAGPLRWNKGLPTIASLVERWHADAAEIPLRLQTTPKHAGRRHGRREGPFLQRISTSAYPHLIASLSAEPRARYLDAFRGAITLVAYAPAVFADQVSGVSLDALLSGSPIVASEGTQAADLVREFAAGETVPFGDVSALDEAIRRILQSWDECSARARIAAKALADRHHPRRFVDAWLGRRC
jgi:hypothetical protein